MLMDVSALDQRRLFRCDTRQASHEHVAQAFSDHGLHWGEGRIDASMSKLGFDGFDIYSLQYGAQVEVRPRAFSDFVLIHMSLAGTIHIDCGALSIDRRTGEAVLLGEQQPFRMQWAPGTRQLILKIPKSRLPESNTSAVTSVLDAVQGRHLRGLVQALLHATPVAGQEVPAPWLCALERSFLLFTGDILRNRCPAPQELRHEERVAARDSRRVDRLVGYIKAHLGAPIGLEDLARTADLSERALHLLCQRHLGRPPMVLLRELRLDAARERICGSPSTAVTDIAFMLGFGHLGRFSQYYRERFGELPTATQSSAEARSHLLN